MNSSCSFSVSCSSDNEELNSNATFILPGYSQQQSCHSGCLNGYVCPLPGFPYTQSCRLTNSSAVPLAFKLRMSDDGTQPAVDSVDQIRSHSDPAWRKGIHFYVEPREFTMNPSQGTILPQGHQDIEVREESSHRRFSTRAAASLQCGRALALLPAWSMV